MPYFSEFYKVEVRDEIVREFTNSCGEVDDMMAGLHEIRMRRAERKYDLKALVNKKKSLEIVKNKRISYTEPQAI